MTTQTRVGLNNFWKRLKVVGTGASDIVVCPISTIGSGFSTTNNTGKYRPVVTEIAIAGRNTNASATTVTIQCKVASGTILFYREIPPTNGVLEMSWNGWIPTAEEDNIQVVVDGSITGHVDVTIGGIFLPSSTPAATGYTGVP